MIQVPQFSEKAFQKTAILRNIILLFPSCDNYLGGKSSLQRQFPLLSGGRPECLEIRIRIRKAVPFSPFFIRSLQANLKSRTQKAPGPEHQIFFLLLIC